MPCGVRCASPACAGAAADQAAVEFAGAACRWCCADVRSAASTLEPTRPPCLQAASAWRAAGPCPCFMQQHRHALLPAPPCPAGCFSVEGDAWLWGFGTSNQLGKGDDDEGGLAGGRHRGKPAGGSCLVPGSCHAGGSCHCAGVRSAACRRAFPCGLAATRPPPANTFAACADEVVPKKLAETKRFAGQKVVQARQLQLGRADPAVCWVCTCACVQRQGLLRCGCSCSATPRRLPMHALCLPPLLPAAGVWRAACGAAVRAQGVTRDHASPGQTGRRWPAAAGACS